MLHIHAWSVCKLRSEFICCFSFQGHVSSLQRILHIMGGKWDFSGIGYDFSQQREYKCSTWAIKNSTGAKNSPWITSFCFRQWAHSLAASAMQTGRFAAILPLVPIPSGSSPPWPSPPKDWGTCSLPAPASARPPLAPAPHHSPSGNPSGLSFWGFCEKRPRIIASSPEVLSPHKGVMASSPPPGTGRGCSAHAEVPGVRLDPGSLFPSAPHVHRSGGPLLPQTGKKAPQRSWCHPACCEERRGPGHGGSSVEREVAQGRGFPSSKMAPCEPLFKEQQDLVGDQQSPASAGRMGELWGTPVAMLPGREAGWGAVGVQCFCGVRELLLCLEGLAMPWCGVWGLSVMFNEKEVLYTVSRYSSKEKWLKKERKKTPNENFWPNLKRDVVGQEWGCQVLPWGSGGSS